MGKLTKDQQGQLNRDERIKTERQQRDIRGRADVQDIQNAGDLAQTRVQGQNQMNVQGLQNQGEMQKTDKIAGYEKQRDTLLHGYKGEENKQMAGFETARDALLHTQKQDENRLIGDQARTSETQKQAFEMLTRYGVPGNQAQQLMNTQPGQTPNVAGIQPTTQDPQVGRWKSRMVTDAKGNVTSEIYDSALGPNAPAATESSATSEAEGSGDASADEALPFPPDPGKRQKGMVYKNARGQKGIWNGEGLELVD